MNQPIAHAAPARSVWSRLYHGETSINFVSRWRRWFLLSGAVIAIGLVSLFTRGFNLGLDFRGGTSWEVKAPRLTVTNARDAVEGAGLAGDVKVQRLGADTIKVQAHESTEAQVRAVSEALAQVASVSRTDIAVNDVGPSWGNEVTSKAQRALILFLAAVTIYIALRFEWKMAIATLVALFHDVLVTAGVYSIFHFEVTPATVIAILTILGYSIYDGIVVFDRVTENARGLASSGRMGYSEMVNVSLNQVLMRTLNTSITALIPIASLLVVGSWLLGATTLEEFALALLVGLGASAYSSIFIASPMLALLKEREPRYRLIRARLASRGDFDEGPPLVPAAASSGSGSTVVGTPPAYTPGPRPPRPPKPRKKRGRRM